ncbi:MAG: hypothetical protein KF736_09195 [Acidobacteria bacterium]|nr:hypothetical protein [Acidobacteriota bacterium]MCW5950226.1 hypothetical protein [Pyrinomonadaceae bacterium]
MAKTQKELAFLRDLYLAGDWTQRFADLVDKHLDLSDSENVLYINAGTAGHAMALEEKYGEKATIFASVEDDDLLAIASEKAAAVRSGVEISSIRFDDDAFDAVIADASLVAPDAAADAIGEAARLARVGGDVAVFLPSAGSFGEIFSLLWEVMFEEGLGDDGAAAESMVSGLPTVEALEQAARDAGLVNVRVETVNEIFEFENGGAFVESPLIADFLMPQWIGSFSDDEIERVNQGLTRLIDEEDGMLSFRFSLKATLLTGEKG